MTENKRAANINEYTAHSRFKLFIALILVFLLTVYPGFRQLLHLPLLCTETGLVSATEDSVNQAILTGDADNFEENSGFYSESYPESIYEENHGKNFVDALKTISNHLSSDFLRWIPGSALKGLANIFVFSPEADAPDSIDTKELLKDETYRALSSLNNMVSELLKDERLIAAVDDIIEELLERERFTSSIQNYKVFAAEIVRDERLIRIIGDVIADFLRDERFSEEILYFIKLFKDLLSHEEIFNYFRDSIFAIFKDQRSIDIINDFARTTAAIAARTTTETMATVAADKRVKEIAKDISVLFIEPVNIIAADLVSDVRLQKIIRDISFIMLSYSHDTAASLLDDKDFTGLIGELIIATVDIYIEALTETVGSHNLAGVIRGVFDSINKELEGERPEEHINILLEEFLTGEEFREYIDYTFPFLIEETRLRTEKNTPEDIFKLPGIEIKINIIRELALGIAEAPFEATWLVGLTWLVEGIEELDYLTYMIWVERIMSIFTPQKVSELGGLLTDIIQNELPDIINNSRETLLEGIEIAYDHIPFQSLSHFLQDSAQIHALVDTVGETMMAHIPFSEIATILRRDNIITDILMETVTGIITRYPLEEIGLYFAEKPEIPAIFSDAIPPVPVKDIIALMETDPRIFKLFMEIVAAFPAESFATFFRAGDRAEIMGKNISEFILTLSADFIGNENLSGFIHDVLVNALNELEDSPGKIIMENTALFFENEDLSRFAAGTMVDLIYEFEPEVHVLYREIVPNFFLRFFLWIAGRGEISLVKKP